MALKLEPPSQPPTATPITRRRRLCLLPKLNWDSLRPECSAVLLSLFTDDLKTRTEILKSFSEDGLIFFNTCDRFTADFHEMPGIPPVRIGGKCFNVFNLLRLFLLEGRGSRVVERRSILVSIKTPPPQRPTHTSFLICGSCATLGQLFGEDKLAERHSHMLSTASRTYR